MVYSAVFSCALKGSYVLGVLDYADNAPVALGIVADRANIPLRQILAALAAVNVLLCVDKRLCEVLHGFLVH